MRIFLPLFNSSNGEYTSITEVLHGKGLFCTESNQLFYADTAIQSLLEVNSITEWQISEGNAPKTFIAQIRLLCHGMSSDCSLWKVIPYDEIKSVDWNRISEEETFDAFFTVWEASNFPGTLFSQNIKLWGSRYPSSLILSGPKGTLKEAKKIGLEVRSGLPRMELPREVIC